MSAFFSVYKPALDAYLTDYISSRKKDAAQTNPWQDDVYGRLQQFIIQGKSVRGCLFLWAIEAYKGKLQDADYALAASFELTHSGFLIHDDVMDNDKDRRGNKTLYAQYEQIAKDKQIQDPERFGKSLAICAGDLSLFLGMDCLLSTSDIPAHYSAIAREFASVCIAQMQDVAFGSDKRLPSRDEILSLYTYKTARYTIMLPLREGAQVGGAPEKDISLLESIGEQIGVIF